MLELKDIKKVYEMGDTQVHALKGISANFGESEFVSILGPSGCGKTTLLNIVGGLDKYTSGDLIIDGKSTKNFGDRDWDTYRNQKIGFVFQNYNLIQHLNVLENVEMALTLSGISREERKTRAKEALVKVGLADQIKKMPNQLSGGQMQRVAIARAIVNNPTIILADEPTGALDSKTSKQIMELLKEISSDKLIIMVTHNSKLAKKYSTRIIKLLDGEIEGDNSQNIEIVEKSEQKLQKNEQIEQKLEQKRKKSSMKFTTALYLSFKNLLTKKGRTILTSIAGSIGIIGVALVLAISNGFNGYVTTMQQDTLSGYPITVTTAAVDFDSLDYTSVINASNTEGTEDAITVTGDMSEYIKYGHYNCINENFLNTVKEFEAEKITNNSNPDLAHIEYTYFAPTKFLIKQPDNSVKYDASKNIISIMQMGSSGLIFSSLANTFFPALSNEDYILDSYDVVYTSSDYDANDMFGLTLVLSKGNKISYTVLNKLGITTETDEKGQFKTIDFERICNEVAVKLLYNDDFYYEYDENTDSFKTINVMSSQDLQTLYDNPGLQSLKVTRIIAPKKESNTSLLSTGIMYSNALQQHYLENCEQSMIAQKQAERKQTQLDNGEENLTFYVPYKIYITEIPELAIGKTLVSTTDINGFLDDKFKTSITTEEAYQIGMQQLGVSKFPQSIVFYPKNFSAKQQVNDMVKEYNDSVGDAYQIIVTDSSEFLTSTLGKIISIISIVLVAFAGISLVVSSIMIGIITYVSVIERTKEIGILRSIGARKRDISHVFSAETIIIGGLSGAIGVLVTYLLCPIISAIVFKLGGISNIAMLRPLHALLLVAISMFLTFIAGRIPSRIASKKDPVECLRTE